MLPRIFCLELWDSFPVGLIPLLHKILTQLFVQTGSEIRFTLTKLAGVLVTISG